MKIFETSECLNSKIAGKKERTKCGTQEERAEKNVKVEGEKQGK